MQNYINISGKCMVENNVVSFEKVISFCYHVEFLHIQTHEFKTLLIIIITIIIITTNKE